MVTKWASGLNILCPPHWHNKQIRSIFWAQIFSWGLKIWSSNLFARVRTWERIQKMHGGYLAPLSRSWAASRKQEGWIFLFETKQKTRNTPPLNLNLSQPRDSERGEHWWGWNQLRRYGRERGRHLSAWWGQGGQGCGLMDRDEHPWTLPGSSLGAFVNGCREARDSFPSYFCLCLKQTFRLVLKRIESNNLFC